MERKDVNCNYVSPSEWHRPNPDPNEVDAEGRPATLIEYLRYHPDHGILAEITTPHLYPGQIASSANPKRGILGYLYCSEQGSLALQHLQLETQHWLSLFDPPDERYQAYYRKLAKELKRSRGALSWEDFLAVVRASALSPPEAERAKRVQDSAARLNRYRQSLSPSHQSAIGMFYVEAFQKLTREFSQFMDLSYQDYLGDPEADITKLLQSRQDLDRDRLSQSKLRLQDALARHEREAILGFQIRQKDTETFSTRVKGL
jgi:hypothetical protein